MAWNFSLWPKQCSLSNSWDVTSGAAPDCSNGEKQGYIRKRRAQTRSRISGWRTSPWVQFLFLPNQDMPPLNIDVFEIWIQLCISVIQILYSFSMLISLERCIQPNWSHSVFVVLQIKSLRTVLYIKFRFEVISMQEEVRQGQFLRTRKIEEFW